MNKVVKTNKLKSCIAILLALIFGIGHAVTNGGSCDLRYLESERMDSNDRLSNNGPGPIEWVIEEDSNGTKTIRFTKPEVTIANGSLPTISSMTKDNNGNFQIANPENSFSQMLAIKRYGGINSGTFTVQNGQDTDSVSREYKVVYPVNTYNPEKVTRYTVMYYGTYRVKMDGTRLDSLTFTLRSSKEGYMGYDRPPRNIIYTIDVKGLRASRAYEFGNFSSIHYPVTDEFNLVCK